MEREMIRQHLAEAEAHIREGEELIAKQHEIVARLESAGADTVEARKLLSNLETAQTMHITDRNRAAAELRAAEK
jgi:antitoxin (DNA-binding transcriptional repressor) of toxin-antitoxin stability system